MTFRPYAGEVVLVDLCRRQRLVIDRRELDLALPLAGVREFVAEHEAVAGVPVPHRVRIEIVDVVGPLAIDVDAAARVDVVGHDDVLQGGLRVLIHVVGHEGRAAVVVDVRRHVPVAERVLIEDLAHRKVAPAVALRVRHDARRVVALVDVRRDDPALDRVLLRPRAGCRDAVVELSARRRVGNGADRPRSRGRSW